MTQSHFSPRDLTPGQRRTLENLGFTLGTFHCQCGACDPEEALVLELGPGVDPEDWEDEHVWEDGEVRETPE